MTAQIDISKIETIADTDTIESHVVDVNGEQFLTFVLGKESYAINILSVKEISGWDDATLIPNSPDYVKGVINLRGTIVPIIDLRIHFQVGEVTYNPTTVVIILSGQTEAGSRTVGFIVDAVSDVLDLVVENLQPAPEFDGTVPPSYVYGLINTDEQVITVLDVTQLLEMGE